jgi:hypothetical protein
MMETSSMMHEIAARDGDTVGAMVPDWYAADQPVETGADRRPSTRERAAVRPNFSATTEH